jgi:hypothetical protein
MGTNPRFRVLEAFDGGIVILANATMKGLLITLLEDLEHRSVTETALMHELREVGAARAAQAVTGRDSRGH